MFWLRCVMALLAASISCQGIDLKDAEAAAAAGDHKYAAIIARDLAKNGDAKAALFLANAHLNASGGEGDLEQAVKWFSRASDQGIVEAGHTLSLLRRKVFQSDAGDPVAQAIRVAFEQYRKKDLAAEFPELEGAGSGESIGARLFKAGRKEEALKTLLREARALDPAAVIFLRIFYFNKVEGVPERDPRIAAFFREAAEEGDPRAREILGRILLGGGGDGGEEQKGMEMLSEATSEESRKMLVKAYLERGWEEKAAGVYRQAGKEGSAWGNFEYAKLLLRDGLRDEAIPYLERSLTADPQHWQATVKLGKALIERRRGLSDLSRGFDLYKRAADDGDDAVSQYVVGLLYLRGTGVPASKEDAVTYFAKAAESGVAQAQEELDKLTKTSKPRMTASSSDVPEEPAVRAEGGGVKPAKKVVAAPKGRLAFHVVEEGDTFYGITLEYGVSYLALRRANPGVNEAKLRLGQKIKLPRK